MSDDQTPEQLGERELIWGTTLRYTLLAQFLDSTGPLTIAQLVTGLERAGKRVCGRPSKVVSDALRWEVAKGRVIRQGRGSYLLGHIPRGTAWHIRRRAAGAKPRRPWE